MGTSLRRASTAILIGAAAWLVLGAGPAAGQGERILRYEVIVTIADDGHLHVRETIDYDFDGLQRHGIYRDIPSRFAFDDTHDRVTPIDDVGVLGSPGTPVDTDVTTEGSITRIQIGDPDRTISGIHTYQIDYDIDGAINGFPDHDELFWNAIGADWSVPIDDARVRVLAPGGITRVACFAGSQGSNLPCERSQVDGSQATASQTSLFPFQGLTVVVGLPKGLLPDPKPILVERWSLGRAFSRTPLTVAGSVGLLAVAVVGFGRLMWREGRDRRFMGSQVDQIMGGNMGADGPQQRVPLFEGNEGPVEFAPPDDMKPGEMGTLIDEVANPLDVTGTIVDLAVRGYLTIGEIPKKGWFGKADWSLVQTKEPDGSLLTYERALLVGLFESGPEVKLSELRTKFATRMRKVQDALYADAVKQGWFPTRPDKTRTRWRLIGILILACGVGLEVLAIAKTKLALLPIPVVIGGLLLAVGAEFLPRRTAKGTALRRRVLGFRRVITSADTHLSRWAEEENVFYRYLPYAIVFGCTDKWAKAFATLAEPPAPPAWYVSPYPFALASFGDELDGFAVTTSGTLTSTPAGSGGSGFSGGFSGGGFGGGGGGSW